MQSETCDVVGTQPSHAGHSIQPGPGMEDRASSTGHPDQPHQSITSPPSSEVRDPQPSTLNAQPPPFPHFPGETPRAFSAFMTFFNLGHSRSLQAVANQLDEKFDTVRKWSSRFRWFHRIQTFNSGLLQHQAETEAALRAEQAADWARRTKNYREHEWDTSQKLLGAVHCFLENFGDKDVEKMTLAQVARAFEISSRIARQALSGTAVPDGPVLVPLQAELAAALKKAYANPPAETGSASPPPADPNAAKN